MSLSCVVRKMVSANEIHKNFITRAIKHKFRLQVCLEQLLTVFNIIKITFKRLLAETQVYSQYTTTSIITNKYSALTYANS